MNHQHFDSIEHIPVISSLDFVKWFREYLEVDESINWYTETKPTIKDKIYNWFFWTFRLCTYCHKHKAVWWYAPSTDDHRLRLACDECIPRGCSCNQELISEDLNPKDPNSYYGPTDEQGREYPCCEWMEW